MDSKEYPNDIVVMFTIPLQPITKKNSSIPITTKTGKKIIIPSAAFQKYQRRCKEHVPVGLMIDCPVNIEAKYYIGKDSRVDISNLHSALHDILVHYKTIKDDDRTIVAGTDGSRVYVDHEYPRTEVIISEFKESV